MPPSMGLIRAGDRTLRGAGDCDCGGWIEVGGESKTGGNAPQHGGNKKGGRGVLGRWTGGEWPWVGVVKRWGPEMPANAGQKQCRGCGDWCIWAQQREEKECSRQGSGRAAPWRGRSVNFLLLLYKE